MFFFTCFCHTSVLEISPSARPGFRDKRPAQKPRTRRSSAPLRGVFTFASSHNGRRSSCSTPTSFDCCRISYPCPIPCPRSRHAEMLSRYISGSRDAPSLGCADRSTIESVPRFTLPSPEFVIAPSIPLHSTPLPTMTILMGHYARNEGVARLRRGRPRFSHVLPWVLMSVLTVSNGRLRRVRPVFMLVAFSQNALPEWWSHGLMG